MIGKQVFSVFLRGFLRFSVPDVWPIRILRDCVEFGDVVQVICTEIIEKVSFEL